MAGDPTNARLWADADVYVSFDLEAEIPTDVETVFNGDWDLIGLLDGETGFTETREMEKSDKYAWGSILMRTSRRNFKETKKFTAFEHNDTTHRLRWPGSDTPGELKVPTKPESILIAFETREGDTVHRLISKYRVECEQDGDFVENEADPASLAFVVTVFPNADGVLWIEQETETGS